jgi:hypothetical protein
MRTGARDRPTLGKTVLLVCILAGCNNLPNEVLYQATQPSRDRQCVDALVHVRECDVRFPDRTELCSFSAASKVGHPAAFQPMRSSTGQPLLGAGTLFSTASLLTRSQRPRSLRMREPSGRHTRAGEAAGGLHALRTSDWRDDPLGDKR